MRLVVRYFYQMQYFHIVYLTINNPEETGCIKIDEAAIPLADVAEITASDEALFKKDEWEGC